jgi:hypothetical protein
MAELKHKTCNGIISIDIAGGFTLRTHSIILTPSEVRLGVLELNVNSQEKEPQLVCVKCEQKFDLEGDLDNVVAMCLVCSKYKSVNELYTSFSFPCICEGCKKEISGESKGKKNKLADIFDVSTSSIKFIPIVEVLRKPIS